MHYPWKLNLTRLRLAADRMQGPEAKNFLSFSRAKESSVRAGRKAMRIVDKIEVVEVKDGLEITVVGKGFLYHQVRHMVGALLACAQNRVSLEYLEELLSEPEDQVPANRLPKWALAEPQGLCLVSTEIKETESPSKLMHPELRHDSFGRISS
jgi:tRNA pseudouridine(38-40) synthase